MSSRSSDMPPSYGSITMADKSSDSNWARSDPRSSSQQSLVPEPGIQHERRKLLLVYLHGFMGNETSFRSFPAHVHNLLTVLLAETHVIHTKLYPRYRSKRNISFARDDFSVWLEPHEDPSTDVVLLGHSMGGLLAAEVVLQAPASLANRPLRHRILGAINFDVPFLGMHPGVVKSGLASIFQPGDGPPQDKKPPNHQFLDVGSESDVTGSPSLSQTPSRTASSLWSEDSNDPNFNAPFPNDVNLPVRKGWQNAWHFVSKHSGNLREATKQLVSSHMEFGGAMANYGELKTRYARIRALEEEDVNIRKSVTRGNGLPPRVRFINYYTVSTGRPKKAAPQASSEVPSSGLQATPSASNLDTQQSMSIADREASETAGVESTSDGTLVDDEAGNPDGQAWDDAMATMTIIDPSPENHDMDYAKAEDDQDDPDESTVESVNVEREIATSSDLPPLPDLPTKPPPLDTSFIQDKDTRKLVENEHVKATKSYEKAVKEREKLVKERVKLEERRKRQAQKDAEKAKRDAEKARKDAEKTKVKAATKLEAEMSHREKEELRMEKEKQRMEAESRRMRGETTPDEEAPTPQMITPQSEHAMSEDGEPATSVAEPSSAPATNRSANTNAKRESKPKAPPKDRKFCSLPPKDSHGERDPCWVRVYMEGVDEVGAHCGLFFVDERYERLVGDVAERIEHWVKEDVSESIQSCPVD